MKPFAALLALGLITACSPQIQTTSGAAFLAARNTPVDADIAAVAAIEPNLQFPARIGIGRISRSGMEPMSVAELDAVAAIQPSASQLGMFAPIDASAAGYSNQGGIHAARLAAARQHLDYIIVYHMTQDGRGIGAQGRADISFVDVRNGYVYGRATVEENLAGTGGERIGWGAFAPSDAGAVKLITAATPDIADMLTQLVNRAS